MQQELDWIYPTMRQEAKCLFCPHKYATIVFHARLCLQFSDGRETLKGSLRQTGKAAVPDVPTFHRRVSRTIGGGLESVVS